ncbi:MAG: endonuclease/exonuclease/phosphatase family protein [Halioglobus sp.]
MFSRTTLKLLWLVPTVSTLLLHFAVAPAKGERSPAACADTLGQMTPLLGAPLEGELEVLSWNIQKASNDGWAQDLASFSEGVHLAFLQEAAIEAAIPDAIASDLYSVFAQGYTTTSRETGVMTLSTGLPTADCQFTAVEPWLGTPKATAVSEYPIAGREDRLLAINLHSVNFDLGMASFNEQLEALSAVLARHDGPAIVAGDLNTWSGSRQQAVDAFMQEHGLGSVAFEPDLRTRAFGRALDHIYVRGMEPTLAQVIPVTSSDHNPLRVRLAIQ